MDKGKKTMKKLQGLEPDQERVFFVLIGNKDKYNEKSYKVYFRTQEQAITYFKIVSTTNPVVIGKKELHSFYYKAIEDELDKSEGGELKFSYLTDNNEITLGSEILRLFESEVEANKAYKKKEEELRTRNEEAEKKAEKKKKK